MNLLSAMPSSSTALAFGFDLAVKATAIMVIVLLIQHVVGHRRSVLASAAANAGLVGLLLLPFAALLFPSIPVACVPGEATAPRSKAASVSIRPSMSAGSLLSTHAQEPASFLPRSEAKLVRRDIDSPAVLPIPVTFAMTPPTRSAPIPATYWAGFATVGYFIVLLALLARLINSLWHVARLKRFGVKVDDSEWTEALERWRTRLAIGCDVALAWSPALSVPVVLGWLRPTIVLPSSLMQPNRHRHADAVLLHELAHVRRADYFWNLVLRLVQALYWPHVIVWLFGRAIAALRERACDDLCVHELGGPSAYRESAPGRGLRHVPTAEPGARAGNGPAVETRPASGADRTEQRQ